MSARASGCAWWTSWTRSAIQPRCPGGSRPPPGGSAGASWARHADRTRLSARSTPRPYRTGRPKRSSRNCSRPSAMRRCARRSSSAAGRPAAHRHARRGSAGAIRRDQRQAGHTHRQHRPDPQPLPGQDAPLPGHRGADQRRVRLAPASHGRGQLNPSTALPGGARRSGSPHRPRNTGNQDDPAPRQPLAHSPNTSAIPDPEASNVSTSAPGVLQLTAPAVTRPAPSPSTPSKGGGCCATASSSWTTRASSCPTVARFRHTGVTDDAGLAPRQADLFRGTAAFCEGGWLRSRCTGCCTGSAPPCSPMRCSLTCSPTPAAGRCRRRSWRW